MSHGILVSMETNYIWWIEALIGILALVGVQYGIKKIVARNKKNHGWKERFGNIVQPPLTAFLWILGGFYFLHVLADKVGFGVVVEYIDTLRRAGIIGCFAWLFFRWKGEVERALSADPHRKIDLMTIKIIGRLSTIIVVLITGLILLQIFGVNIVPLLTFGSIGAASIGFAGKDVIANFCSGIMLHITRPFVIGDLIFLPQEKLEGYIEEIGWFRTSIRDKEKRPVYLPNNFFSTMLVVNVSRLSHRHVKQSLKIGYTEISKIESVVKQIRELIVTDPHIDKDQPIYVHFNAFGSYACEIEIEAHATVLDQEEFHQYQQGLLLRIQAILEKENVSLAYPTMAIRS